MALLNNQNSK